MQNGIQWNYFVVHYLNVNKKYISVVKIKAQFLDLTNESPCIKIGIMVHISHLHPCWRKVLWNPITNLESTHYNQDLHYSIHSDCIVQNSPSGCMDRDGRHKFMAPLFPPCVALLPSIPNCSSMVILTDILMNGK